MVQKIQKFLKNLFGREKNTRKNKKDIASLEQVKKAVRYVDERFSHAITRLSER